MLDRLDGIPWHQLHHAYGAAADVPGLLRALAGSGEQRENAIYELFGNIWHQGTVYEATSHAVPFLVELAAEATVTKREEILGLIGALADGSSYLAVHAQPGLKIGEFFRQKPDFEEKLNEELKHVRLTRDAVHQRKDVFCSLLKDHVPMVRAGAAHVLSRFPECAPEFGPLIIRAAQEEPQPLVGAGMVWSLGALHDSSPSAIALLDAAVAASVDPRQTFAAAIAFYRITGAPHGKALHLYNQLAAATWFAEEFLSGVPWDFSSEVHRDLEILFAQVAPDPFGATQTLMTCLNRLEDQNETYPSMAIVHDLLELNFPGGKWRECKQLTNTQAEILQRLVDTDAAWSDTKRLWFLLADRTRSILEIKPSDIEDVRIEMRSILDRHGKLR